MANDSPPSNAVRRLVLIAVGLLMTVATGLLVSWQLAPFVLLLYFVAGWATDRALRNKRDAEDHPKEWLNKENGSGKDTEGKANGSLGTPPH